jgi:hypothetical protein
MRTRSQKNYAVGLEIACPGGVHDWAPEIPSPHTIAAAVLGKCELAHSRGAFFPKRRRLSENKRVRQPLRVMSHD